MYRAEEAAKPPARWASELVRAALFLYWIALFATTHLPIHSSDVAPGNDKMHHVVGYAILALLFGWMISSPRPRFGGEGQGKGTSASNDLPSSRRFPFIGALILLALYGVFDELTQLLVGRTGEFYDWLADVAGIVIGLAFVAFFTATRQQSGD